MPFTLLMFYMRLGLTAALLPSTPHFFDIKHDAISYLLYCQIVCLYYYIVKIKLSEKCLNFCFKLGSSLCFFNFANIFIRINIRKIELFTYSFNCNI